MNDILNDIMNGILNLLFSPIILGLIIAVLLIFILKLAKVSVKKFWHLPLIIIPILTWLVWKIVPAVKSISISTWWWIGAILALILILNFLRKRKFKYGDAKTFFGTLLSDNAVGLITTLAVCFVLYSWIKKEPKTSKVTIINQIKDTTTKTLPYIGPDIHWGRDTLNPGKKHFYNRYVTFYPRAVSTEYWGDTLHFKKKGFEKTVYWDLVFDEFDGTPRRVNDYDDRSNGDFYIEVKKQIIVNITDR